MVRVPCGSICPLVPGTSEASVRSCPEGALQRHGAEKVGCCWRPTGRCGGRTGDGLRKIIKRGRAAERLIRNINNTVPELCVKDSALVREFPETFMVPDGA